MMKRQGIILLLILSTGVTCAQNRAINVLHYGFDISLSDSSNQIQGIADVDFISNQPADSMYLDLAAVDLSRGTGMKVSDVSSNGRSLKYFQQPERLDIYFDSTLTPGSDRTVRILYGGIPGDGLIIDRNKFHHKTFFADNWPNRAHDWIPCNDHPSDKASVDFTVTAPDHYQVVANGVLVEQTELPDHRRLTHWKESLPLPTKVMVIGVADFAVRLSATIGCIPVTSWVFPENRVDGFREYAISGKVLSFLISYIGPYPYSKLANVQSKTIFGGMENAGNIFYYENSVTPDSVEGRPVRSLEELFAHETAHQWFGDEASEADWPHVWLSEGFATYMTHLYIEHVYGSDSLSKQMSHDRQIVLDFYKKHKTPVVDTTETRHLMLLLNPNSYQKGSWVLHMLRRKLGDALFQKGIRAYYLAYKGRNASTDDFRKVMEKTSGMDLKTFFKQWLYTAGQPSLAVTWKYDPHTNLCILHARQLQDVLFSFPLQYLVSGEHSKALHSIDINARDTTWRIPLSFVPRSVTLDPDVNLLFAGTVTQEP